MRVKKHPCCTFDNCIAPALRLAAVIAAGQLSACAREESRAPAPKPAPVPNPAPTPVPVPSWFSEITDEIGLNFIHESGAKGKLLMPEVMSAGVALFDYDNDQDLDVYLTSGNRVLPNLEPGGDTPNRLFRQEAGGRFTDVTETAGIGDKSYGMGVAIGDFDNDGDPDVYVTNLGSDRLYRNRGDGTFEDFTDAAGVSVDGWSASACFFDYDADGYLDLYVTRYVQWDPTKKCFAPDGRPTYCGPRSFLPQRDVLLHNEAGKAFTDVSEKTGIRAAKAAGLGLVCEDFNGDDRFDVYVANDAYVNQLWINQGDGTFRDEAKSRGAGFNLNGEPEAGMGVISADFDNDGRNDLFMTHLSMESNTFYRNLGPEIGFVDATGAVGLGWSSVPFTGFGTVALDVELDGDLDVFLVNGRVKREDPVLNPDLPFPWNVLAEPNLFYLNKGKARFEQITEFVESLCEPVEVSRGLAAGDLDSDGDLDLVLSTIQGPARVYRNDTPRKGAWLQVGAWNPRWHRYALGAEVTVVSGDQRWMRTVRRAYSYLSSNDPRVHFGLGRISKIDRVEVDWKDGFREYFTGVSVNETITLVRGTGTRR